MIFKIVDTKRFVLSVFITLSTIMGSTIGFTFWQQVATQWTWIPFVANFFVALSIPSTSLLAYIKFVGKDAALRFIEKHIGIYIADESGDIRIIMYGLGGTGKSTLVSSLFKYDRGPKKRTVGVHEHVALLTHESTVKKVLLIDYEGQKDQDLRDKLRELQVKKRPVHVILFVVSFFACDEDPNTKLSTLIVPESSKEKQIAIDRHIENQMKEIAPPVIRELVRGCPDLRSVFLVINQIDMLDQMDGVVTTAGRVEFANRNFNGLINEISNVVDNAAAQGRHIEFSVSYVSATKGLEICSDRHFEIQGMQMGIGILNKFKGG